MTDDPLLQADVRRHREASGLSQQALAERAGISRQALGAIEGGRQVPSTAVALRLARVLGCGVEDLFRLAGSARMVARLAARPGTEPRRLTLGRVADRWVAHALEPDGARAADGLAVGGPSPDGTLRVEPLIDPERAAATVLVAGCAPVLGALAGRVQDRFPDTRVAWIPANSEEALALLQDDLVHVAGMHLAAEPGARHAALVRARFPGRALRLVTLAEWRLGLVVAPGNPERLHAVADLLRPGVRVAVRELGAGAARLLERGLARMGAAARLTAPVPARSHAEVARAVASGAAHAGIAIEAVARARGLGFVPLLEERFDLAVPAALAAEGPVARFLDVLTDRAFRRELEALEGYSSARTGESVLVAPEGSAW